MAVAIVPGLFMAIVTAGRKKLVEDLREIFLKPWLEFYRADCAGAAHIKDICHAGTDPRGIYDLRNFPSQVVHLAVAGGLDLNLSLVNHSASSVEQRALCRRVTSFRTGLMDQLADLCFINPFF